MSNYPTRDEYVCDDGVPRSHSLAPVQGRLTPPPPSLLVTHTSGSRFSSPEPSPTFSISQYISLPSSTAQNANPPASTAERDDVWQFDLAPRYASTEVPEEKRFFCTFCAELGIEKRFGTKYDWIRHEQNFHYTHSEWHCLSKECLGDSIFERKQAVKKHIQKMHLDQGYVMPDPPYREVLLQDPQLFACGFEFCGKITTTWEDRCNHVSECMRQDAADWSYTRKICALLKHPVINPTWKIIKAYWSQSHAFWALNALEWDPKSTRSIRQQLECLNFDKDLEEILHRLFKLGLPHSKPSSGFYPVVADNFQFTPLISEPAETLSPDNLSLDQVSSQPQSLTFQPPKTQDPDQLVPMVPFSDSGYGTTSHCSRKVAQLTTSNTAACADMIAPLSNHPQDSQEPGKDSNVIDLDTDDTATNYSEAMSLADLRIDSYVSGLAEDLFGKLDTKLANDRIIERLSTTLPELLKAMALKFGFEASSQMHRDVMFFVHMHRMKITQHFKSNFGLDEPCPERERGESHSEEVMNRWLGSNDDLQFEQYPEDDIEERDDPLDDLVLEEDEEFDIPGLQKYRQFICNDPGYRWLVDRLRRDIYLSTPGLGTMDNIRDEILQSSRSKRRISRRRSSQGCRIQFRIEWDPFAFLDEQDFDEPAAQAIANAITLTGSCKDAQALSCREYLAQTWPSTGPRVIQLIQELLRDRDSSVTAFGKTSNGTTLSASLSQSFLVVEAAGIPDFVAEIGEQLAWLGAALRTVPSSSKVVYSVPFIDSIISCTSGDPGDGPKELQCSIKFRIEDCNDVFQNTNGQCWHSLFKGPVIARGFPIPRRSELEIGLEIPLNMLAALTRTRYVDIFSSKVFIKGFSSMLVPTKKTDDLLIWHLLHNKSSSERISYLDCGVEHADVKIADLERARHVVGWCSEAVSNVGALAANYSISKSNLPYAHSTYGLEQAQISAGQFITGTAVFSFGKKEKPVHISRFGYHTKMQWISSKYVNLWDVEEKKGWLVNGASALLHLLRASLKHSERKFKSAFLMNPDDLADAADYTSPESVMEVLIDAKYRDLKLYVDKSEVIVEEIEDKGESGIRVESRKVTRYYRLEDRVEHIYNILEKLMDHQTDVERKSGLQINLRPRRQLEGWDFRDLFADGDPFSPRVAEVQAIGKGWVDFTRAIHTVTLFGRGFGHLIQPKRTGLPGCSRWSSLPRGRYYLAACVSDLKEIMENDGDSTCNPMQLCGNVLWHTKHAMFQPCPCIGDSTSKHHDPVQALFPLKFKTKLRKKPLIDLKDRGAVIFGHNASLHWHWRDDGDPVKGDLPPAAEDIAVPFSDSGLGSSLGSSNCRIGSQSGSSANNILQSGQLTTRTSSDINVSETQDSESVGLDSGKPRSLKRPLHMMMSSISKKVKLPI